MQQFTNRNVYTKYYHVCWESDMDCCMLYFIPNVKSFHLLRWKMTGNTSPWSSTGFSSGFL